MINYFLTLIMKNSFFIFFILMLISIFLLYLIIIFIDDLYRPNIPYYPQNWFFDLLLPFTFIISPFLFLAFTLPKTIFLEKLLMLISIHIFFITPLIFFWSKHRNWSTLPIQKSWIHPHTFLHITISILYPLMWLIYFNVMKYLRLGKSLDLTYFFSTEAISVYILIFFLWPFISIWIRLFLWIFLDFRNMLWNELMILLNSLNIFLLKYKFYFKFMEIHYKISYIFVSYMSKTSLLYIRPTKFQKIAQNLYRLPIIINIFTILLIITELLFTKGYLLYSLYFVIFIAITRSIFYFYGTFNGPANTWVLSCCISNYRYLKWDVPYYPINFWLWFKDIRAEHNYLPEINQKTLLMIEKNIKGLQELQNKKNKKELIRLQKYYAKSSTGYKNRLKLSYNQWTQVRWVHTQALQQTATKWHALVPCFAKSIAEKLTVIQNHWSHFNTFEQLESKKKNLNFYKELNIYKSCDFFEGKNPNQIAKISKVVENNLMTNFTYLEEKAEAKILPFNKDIKLDSQSQSNPDVIFDFSESNHTIIDKRKHGMDQKATQSSNEPTSKIYSQMSSKRYNETIHGFFQQMQYNSSLTTNQTFIIKEILRELVETCNNLQTHQYIWAKHLHHFPNKYIPPLRIPSNICDENFTPEFLIVFERAKRRMEFLSNYFKDHKVGENDLEKACEIFQGSLVQKILEEI